MVYGMVSWSYGVRNGEPLGLVSVSTRRHTPGTPCHIHDTVTNIWELSP